MKSTASLVLSGLALGIGVGGLGMMAIDSADDPAPIVEAQLTEKPTDIECSREWATVRVSEGPVLVWLCGGAYHPEIQPRLDALAGDAGMSATLTPQADGTYAVAMRAGVPPLRPPGLPR